MKLTMIVTALFSLACMLPAQAPSGLSAEAKQAYNGIKNNLTRMADKMPEEHYSFKASPDIRTFGELLAHVADSQARTCSAVNGEPKAVDAAKKTGKEALVAALKESFAICDAAFESLTDATASTMITSPRGQRTKLGTLNGVITHGNEEYGYMAVYLRIKGIVPPSSDRR
jgi:uncharacterized damage-inducible protein DinB